MEEVECAGRVDDSLSAPTQNSPQWRIVLSNDGIGSQKHETSLFSLGAKMDTGDYVWELWTALETIKYAKG